MHLEGENNETIIVAIASPDNIYIQGQGVAMTLNEFRAKVSTMLSKSSSYSFVIQSPAGPSHRTTKDVLAVLKESGVNSRHIAVAKSGA